MTYEMDNFDMHDVYKNKTVIPKIINNCYVVRVSTLLKKRVCISIYDNDTLYELYHKSYNALYPSNNGIKVESAFTIRDIIPDEPLNIIHDILVCDKKENMLSIPCDQKTTFSEFKRANERYFVPSSKIPVLRVYKLYVVDNHDAEHYAITKQKKKQGNLVDTMKRYLRCSY
jgi:hypothetical protein